MKNNDNELNNFLLVNKAKMVSIKIVKRGEFL